MHCIKCGKNPAAVLRWMLLAFALLLAACSESAQREVEVGPPDAIAGLVGAFASEQEHPPELVAGASPELSAELERALRALRQEVKATLRVVVAADGSPIGVAVVETVPADSQLARRYGDELADDVWLWQYDAARRNGAPVRAYLDLKFRYGGGDHGS